MIFLTMGPHASYRCGSPPGQSSISVAPMSGSDSFRICLDFPSEKACEGGQTGMDNTCKKEREEAYEARREHIRARSLVHSGG